MGYESTLKVDSVVPFSDRIYWRLYLNNRQSPARLLEESHQYDYPYLAWETVRKRRNPFFEQGTGFEGYFVGICHSPDEMLARILSISRGMLVSIARLYRYEYSFQSKLRKTLNGESSDPKAMAEWSAQLGATLARLRCNLLHNQNADAFRDETYRIVSGLPPIDYHATDHALRQVYCVDTLHVPNTVKIIVNLQQLPDADQEAWQVAQAIGKFGHPLVREYLHYSSN
ncbi:MAG: hypothetical protein IT324_20115 [Anaerolineae bacterium]|nr:hypothetical protein [Anaerolineae bacterium]